MYIERLYLGGFLNGTVKAKQWSDDPSIGPRCFLKFKMQMILKRSVAAALKEGYRHFDTAAIYHNEAWLGEALAESDVKREDLYITSKVWNSNRTYDETIAAFHESLKKLQTDYLDLYLIHWPSEGYNEKWRAMEDLYNDGLIKSIGVSNFEKPHLENY